MQVDYTPHSFYGTLTFPSWEIWADVPGYVGKYQVSNKGRLKSLKRLVVRILHQSVNRGGYKTINLSKDAKPKWHFVHRLVLAAFVGARPEGKQCRHLNGIRDDNRVENLCWGTIEEDWEDKRRHGTACIGEKQGPSKLTDDKVREIRWMWDTGMYQTKELACLFSVGTSTINRVTRKTHWKHVV